MRFEERNAWYSLDARDDVLYTLFANEENFVLNVPLS
jgi:hypothetical protein